MPKKKFTKVRRVTTSPGVPVPYACILPVYLKQANMKWAYLLCGDDECVIMLANFDKVIVSIWV